MVQNLIDPAEMRSRMLTLDQAKERLAPTEGLTEYEFATDGDSNKLKFDFPDNWNMGLDALDDFAPTSASLDLDGTEIALTKNGALELASAIGLNKAYLERTPGNFIGPQLDYHYANGANGKKSLKILAADSGALAVTRGTIQTFSGTRLLDAVVEGISSRFGTDDVMIDYKWNHSLARTNMRLIIPSVTRSIGSARAEKAGDDPWSMGIEIANSIQGSGPLELSGSMFAWWCTNGMTIERASSGKYRRKASLSPEDAYEWARNAVDDVFNDLEGTWESIEHLTRIPLEGEVHETVGRIFERYDVPANARERVIANLVDNDDMTAYGLIAAISEAANDVDNISANEVTSLLKITGNVAEAFEDRCPHCHKI